MQHDTDPEKIAMLLLHHCVSNQFSWLRYIHVAYVNSMSSVCLYCVSEWQRSVSCQATWKTISGKWETLGHAGLAVRSTTTASEEETLHTSSTWTTLMCWRSGIWCLSSSTGRIRRLGFKKTSMCIHKPTIYMLNAENPRRSWSLFLRRALIRGWVWRDWSLSCRTRCRTTTQTFSFLTLMLSRRYKHICRTSVLITRCILSWPNEHVWFWVPRAQEPGRTLAKLDQKTKTALTWHIASWLITPAPSL